MRCLSWVTLVVLGLVGAARAEPPDRVLDDRDPPILRRWRFPLVVLETTATLIPPAIYYWNTTNLQREDWEMGWTWRDWRTKLTSLDALALDTGYWEANAIRHPIGGALGYQVARANGFGIVSSTGVDLIGAAAWEYLAEFKERPSVNDLIVNSISGFLLGEPLFQIGRAADRRGASWARHAMGWVVSPVHRLHAASRYASWRDGARAWTSFEVGLGAATADFGDGTAGEATLRFDLELVGDHRYGASGDGTTPTRAAAWNRAAGEVRVSREGLARAWLHTSTTYAGRYTRSIDAAGDGTDRFVGAAAGIEYESRRLPAEWDHELVFHLIGPRLALGWWTGGHRVLWELGGYGDLAMVQAHVFGPVPPFEPMPQRSVLQARGYYYATGLTLATRIRVDASPWFGALEARAQQMWSIDGLDRVELGGGLEDPHDVADQRAHARAAVGLWTRPDLRVEVTLDGALRRGTWQTDERTTVELGAGASAVVRF
jgi:hypothetical protein